MVISLKIYSIFKKFSKPNLVVDSVLSEARAEKTTLVLSEEDFYFLVELFAEVETGREGARLFLKSKDKSVKKKYCIGTTLDSSVVHIFTRFECILHLHSFRV